MPAPRKGGSHTPARMAAKARICTALLAPWRGRLVVPGSATGDVGLTCDSNSRLRTTTAWERAAYRLIGVLHSSCSSTELQPKATWVFCIFTWPQQLLLKVGEDERGLSVSGTDKNQTNSVIT